MYILQTSALKQYYFWFFSEHDLIHLPRKMQMIIKDFHFILGKVQWWR